MAYRTIHTTYGLRRMAAAESTGVPINLTHMAVGDGGGNDVEPFEEQNQLRGEKYRASVNRVFQNPDNPLHFAAELIIPAAIGGFVIREVGIYDAELGLFAVGNVPSSYKPNISEGAYSDSRVVINFLVSNANFVTLMVDPNIVTATRTWVSNFVNLGTLMPGGTTDQVWCKNSNIDGDAEWKDRDVANVTVDMIEERQTLVADQRTVAMVKTTTRGLAVYIDGHRINKGPGPEEWRVAGTGASQTDIVLGKSYPAGTRIIMAQNDPTGNAAAPLERNLNLSDLENAETARSNLGVYSKAEVDQKTPTSAVMYFPRSSAPTGWLKANGALISRTAYANLYTVIGTTYGEGDGFNTFALPDLRGEFIRGLDDNRGVDANRRLGSAQDSQNRAHTHTASSSSSGSHSHGYLDVDPVTTSGTSIAAGNAHPGVWGRNNYRTTDSSGSHSHAVSVMESGAIEARPRNIALLACIKY